MKHNSSTRKIKLSLTTSPLLRFIQRKRRKRKCNLNLVKNSIFLETSQCLEIPTTKGASNKIVPYKINTSVKNDKSNTVSIVQMPSTCKNNYDNILNMDVFCDSDKDDREQFTSPKCLISTGNEVEHCALDTSDQNNSNIITINQVRNHNDQLHTTSSGQNKVARSLNGLKGKCSITVYTLDGNISTANMYELNHSKYLVVLKPENLFYFIGIVELELIQGSVEILGYSTNERNKKMLLFSPLAYCHIFIKGTSDKNENHNVGIKREDLLHLGLSGKFLKEVLKECDKCSVFTLSRKNDHVSCSVWPYLFESHLPISVLSVSDLIGTDQENRSCNVVESRIGCILGGKIRDQGKEFNEFPEWPRILEDITYHGSPKVIICGGKGVGKSTFLRYLINKLLKKLNRVLVLDFDPGQCEFTVPGCISVTLVEEPVLGPNFTHLKQPLRSVFLGEVDVTKCPEDYIEGCKFLIKYARKEHSTTPWLVNTMGFSKGFGVTLTCGIIQNVGPTNVIQIESKNKKFNFPSLLEPGFVNNQNVGSFSTDEVFIVYNLHILSSAAEYRTSTPQKIRGLSPLEARNLVLLSYLSNMLNSVIKHLSQVTPYMIHMEAIDLKTTNKANLTKSQIAATMNGNLVALCCQTEDDVFPNCLGFGIVRGIDVKTGTLYLITPITTSTLRKVNCLIKGNVNLPESLYYNQGHHIKGHIPYMAYTSGGSTALFARRDYRILPTTSRQPKSSLGS